MKPTKLAFALVAAAIAGLGITMAATNPSPDDYEAYATEALTLYLQQEGETICDQVQVPDFLGDIVDDQCPRLLESLLQSNQREIRALIARGTQRQNYGVLSIYRTNLEISSLLPGYEFETVGIFRRFYTYKAERL